MPPEQPSGQKFISRRIHLLAIAALVIVVVIAIAKKVGESQLPANVLPAVVTTTHVAPAISPDILLTDNQTTTTTSEPVQPTPETATPAPTPAAPKPLISAEEYLVEDLDTGKIYIDHDSTTVYPIASLSKLLVIIVALHTRDLNQQVTITQSMLDPNFGPAGELVLGEKLTVQELFSPLLLESSNTAAEAIAQSDPGGYDAFIAKMNSFAAEMGMTSTHFKDASGLSPGNVSNAHDLFLLAQYLYNSEPSILAITRTTQVVLPATSDHGAHIWNTINPFPLDPHFMGGKTGRTDEAKETMLSLFKYESGPTTYHLAVIVLRSDFNDRQIDSAELLEQTIGKLPQ